MIKFIGKDRKTGDWTVGLGLSEGNIRLLRENKPISVDLKEMGLDKGRILILWGPTEKEIIAQLKDLDAIGPETNILDQSQRHEQT